jgi:hypothetical protein
VFTEKKVNIQEAGNTGTYKDCVFHNIRFDKEFTAPSNQMLRLLDMAGAITQQE